MTPEEIEAPVQELLGWQIPFLPDVGTLLGKGASENAQARIRDSRGWIWGAMLIGMADWASVSGDDKLWDFLQV